MNNMRRAKLAPVSLPPGSLPSTGWYKTPRCFVCDEPIKSHRLSTSLLAGRTQYSHSPLPTKIGGYIGDEFIVVVTAEDALCKHCMALINTMDRMEQELREHQNTLVQHLKTKYRLDGSTDESSTGAEVDQEEREQELIEAVDEEWKPSKKQRIETAKQHRCSICNASFTNVCLFMAHLSRHRQQEKSKPTSPTISMSKAPAGFSSTISNTNGSNFHFEEASQSQSLFRCGCCAESFSRKDKLAEHMHIHTNYPKKESSISSRTTLDLKPSSISSPKSYQQNSDDTIQSSALFQDLDELPQPEAHTPSSMCTEEQKGRVCLLALLNNGLCSDLSHCESVSSAPLSTHNDLLAPVPQEQSSVAITVSLPSGLDFSEVIPQPPSSLENPLLCNLTSNLNAEASQVSFSPSNVISLPPSNQQSNGSHLELLKESGRIVKQRNECYVNKSIELNQNQDKTLQSDSHASSSSDISSLNESSLPNSTTCEKVTASGLPIIKEVNSSDWMQLDSEEELSSEASSKEPIVALCEISSGKREIQALPDLFLDSDLPAGPNGPEKSPRRKVSQKLQTTSTLANTFSMCRSKSSVAQSDNYSGFEKSMLSKGNAAFSSYLHNDVENESSVTGRGEIMTSKLLSHEKSASDQSERNEIATDPINNIAIVNVMSVQMKSDNFDVEDTSPEWCYPGNDQKEYNNKLLFPHSWLDKCKEENSERGLSDFHNMEKRLCVTEDHITTSGNDGADSVSEQEVNCL